MTGICLNWSPTGSGWSATGRPGPSRGISRIMGVRCLTAHRGMGPVRASRNPAPAGPRRAREPLRQAARRAEEKITRLTEEREALDRLLAQPPDPRDNGPALTAALKRRAELMLSIERAEIEWLAAEETGERDGPG